MSILIGFCQYKFTFKEAFLHDQPPMVFRSSIIHRKSLSLMKIYSMYNFFIRGKKSFSLIRYSSISSSIFLLLYNITLRVIGVSYDPNPLNHLYFHGQISNRKVPTSPLIISQVEEPICYSLRVVGLNIYPQSCKHCCGPKLAMNFLPRPQNYQLHQ